ncbi:hypothetical protein [Rubrobacter indicoceani]|uniref:RsiG family protein n=1 Tax=Rubrobacter indicoceani TaxID=2051957 RepID=UPI000E5A4445|nr:hypothetical protein [Rubrobacter indicoceani]
MGEESQKASNERKEATEGLIRGSSEEAWGKSEDLTSLSVEELKKLLDRFDEEEKAISYQRRILQGRIDVIRAEIVRRGGAALSPEELARVLMGDVGRDPGNPDGANG